MKCMRYIEEELEALIHDQDCTLIGVTQTRILISKGEAGQEYKCKCVVLLEKREMS